MWLGTAVQLSRAVLESHCPPPSCLGPPAVARIPQRLGFRLSRHAQHSSPRSTDMRDKTRHAQHRCAWIWLTASLTKERSHSSALRVRHSSPDGMGGQWCPPSRTARVKSVHAVVGVSARPEMAAVTPPRCRGRLWVSKKIQLCLGAESLPTRSSVPDACTRLSKSKITPVVPRKLRFKPAQRPCTAIIPFGQPSCLQWVRKG